MDLRNPTASEGYRVCIVDDDDSFRLGLLRALNASGLSATGYRCAGEYLLAESMNPPSCLVLDMWMPGPTGMELLQALAVRDCAPPVIFVTACSDVPVSVRAMKSGAVDFLEKPITLARLLNSVRGAINRDIQRRAVRMEAQQVRQRYNALSERERTVLCGIIDGKLNKQLAAGLDACERTVKTYRASVMRKMHATSVADLVKAARLLENFP
jgi:FixJ family two-component response regulator